jgi:hypothetical protein
MVYIVGVDHLVQYDGPVPETLRVEFREYLVEISRSCNIELIAEEFNTEALHDVYHATRDTALEASGILGIPHRFCDPEDVDLRKLGIPYFAELMDRVKNEQGIGTGFIPDDALRARVREQAAAISKIYWHRRESFWYDRIAADTDLNILFICGHEHTDGFKAILEANGIPCRILETFWREDIFFDYKNINLG